MCTHMVNITLTIPENLKVKLQNHKEVNWSAVARMALEEYLRKIEIVESIASKSKLTEKDAEEIGRKIKREMAKELGLIK